MTHSTNIIDKPRIAGARDLLGTDKYMEALIRFISNANLPTTIAIQGEWGSGKTSMMNQIRHNVCERTDAPDNPFYGIWINTWQYSLMSSQNETIIKVISGLTKEILSIVTQKHESSTSQLTKKVGGILSLVAKSAAKTAISATGLDGSGIVDGVLSTEGGEANILELRDALQEAVDKCLEEDKKAGNPKKGFLFFIDDLDRIDPPIAVEILEIIKNIFEVENCLFILAIDYEVVVKGLEPKFGKLTEKNEREFRSFFDKIIQLPFSMPLGSYSIDQFLIESLHDVNYIDEVLLKDEEFQTLISQMATESVGTNPRGIKRLINTLSLIQIMNELEEGEFGESRQEKLLNFGLVCIQIAYPSIYELISEEPNFISWDEKLANKLRLKTLSEEQVEMLDNTEEFDEDWEKVIFRACINDAFLSGRAFNVSSLLNLIKGLVPKGANFEEEIEKILTLSAVTSVNMEKVDKAPKFSKVRMSGIGAYLNNLKNKGISAQACEVTEYIYNYVNEREGERVMWQFTPNMLTIQAANSKIRSKTITGIIPRKKNVKLSWLHRFGAEKDIPLNTKEDFTEELAGYISKGIEMFEEGKEAE